MVLDFILVGQKASGDTRIPKMRAKTVIIGSLGVILALLGVLVLAVILVTEPLSLSSYDTWFGRWFDVLARYKVNDKSVDIYVIQITAKDARREDCCGRGTTEEIWFGLAEKTDHRWRIKEQSEPILVNRMTEPGDTFHLFFRHFSIPIDSTVDLRKRWVVLEASGRVQTRETKDQLGSFYAHSDKHIFHGLAPRTNGPTAAKDVEKEILVETATQVTPKQTTALEDIRPLEANELVAKVYDTSIYGKDIEPSEELRKRRGWTSPNRNWDQYRSQRLSSYIWDPLRDKFMTANGIKVSNQDLEAFADAMLVQERLSNQRRREQMAQWERELKGDGITEEKRKQLGNRVRMTKERLDRSDDEIRDGFIKGGTFIVTSWKFNQGLYKRYGGTVIWQQFGIEPLEAYRKFLKERQKRGDFEIYNEALKKKFWAPFLGEPHFEIPKEKVNFDKPWWLWTEEEIKKYGE